MVTISHVVNKLVDDRAILQEAMYQDIVSFGSLAKQLKPEIEKELKKEVQLHAIVMALHRYAETLKETHSKITFDYTSEIILKTDICDIAVLRSPSLFAQLKKIYEIIDFEKGDIFNIIHGRKEVSIVTNERYHEKVKQYLKAEKILNTERNLISLTLTYPNKFLHTPGVIFNIVRNIAWESINILEIVSTNSELTFILHKDDAVRGYKALEKLVAR